MNHMTIETAGELAKNLCRQMGDAPPHALGITHGGETIPVFSAGFRDDRDKELFFSAAKSLFWLRGVVEYYFISSAYMVVGATEEEVEQARREGVKSCARRVEALAVLHKTYERAEILSFEIQRLRPGDERSQVIGFKLLAREENDGASQYGRAASLLPPVDQRLTPRMRAQLEDFVTAFFQSSPRPGRYN